MFGMETGDDILNKKIKDILDQIETVNKLIADLENDKTVMDDFLIIQYNYQKVDFLKELGRILISSNLPTAQYVDHLLDAINLLDKYNPEASKKNHNISKPLDKQFKRLDAIIHEEKSLG